MTITLPQLAWHNPSELNLNLPDGWEVTAKNMSGYNRQALSNDQIGSLIKNPIDGLPIRDKARGKKEVAVIFDDMSRPTPVAEIVPFSDRLQRTPAWKRPGIRLKLQGSDLSSAILEDRETTV